jgi:hypothetical protein
MQLHLKVAANHAQQAARQQQPKTTCCAWHAITMLLALDVCSRTQHVVQNTCAGVLSKH